MNPMSTAPKDRPIDVLRNDGVWYAVEFQDCQHMRDDGEDIKDAWSIDGSMGPGHVELDEAQGWLELNTITSEEQEDGR